MFAAYATSNRGRGDHTYAWTVQAEEGGLTQPAQLADYVAESQTGKAVVDSLGLCDFFAADLTSEPFLGMYAASQFGKRGMADALRRELAPAGVTVEIVEPLAKRAEELKVDGVLAPQSEDERDRSRLGGSRQDHDQASLAGSARQQH